MKILFVNSIRMFGGGEVWMLRTLVALQTAGHFVWLCCRPETELARRAQEKGIPLKPVRFRGDFDPVNVLDLAWFMVRNRIEVVLTNMDKELRTAGLAARLAGVPAIVPRRGIDYPLKNRWRYRFAYNVLATRIIANSRATKAALLRNAPWLDEKRIEVIYNGINVQDFAACTHRSMRREWGIAAGVPVLGFVGQLDERKGIGVLLSAFDSIVRKTPEVHLVMVGEGPLRETVDSEARSKSWRDRVVLAGFVDDIPAVMQAIDVLVLPSYWEGFGIVLIEAMAAGRPAITTRVSSMPEIVEHESTGYLIEPGDAGSLADRAIELLRTHDLRVRMGNAARTRVEKHFSMEKMIKQLERLFQSESSRKTWRQT